MAPSLRISIGSSVEDLKTYNVNSEEPFLLSNSNFQGRVAVRIKDFTGETPEGKERIAHTKYFDEGHAKGCSWSIQLQGRLLKEVPAENLVWGNLFEKPIRDRLPWGTSAALKAVSYIDPSLKQDIYADKPWAFSPLIATMTRINVAHVPEAASAKTADELFALPSVPPFSHGATEPGGTYVHDDTSALLLKSGTSELLPEVEDFADLSTVRELKDEHAGHKKRFTFWGSAAHREAATFKTDDVTECCFDNGFLDFNSLRLELPYTGGMGFDLLNYWDGQPVRFVLRDERDEEVFLIVEFQITNKDA